MNKVFRHLENILETIFEGRAADSVTIQPNTKHSDIYRDAASEEGVQDPQHILDTTHSLDSASTQVSFPEGAFLILHDEHIPIESPILNIGRRADNQLQLEDRTVSRTHAQIRARDSHFILIDLGSSTGTFQNGYRIEQAILQSGDVITIGSHKLVYIESPAAPPDTTASLKPIRPPEGDG